jgi:hypothetical protein
MLAQGALIDGRRRKLLVLLLCPRIRALRDDSDESLLRRAAAAVPGSEIRGFARQAPSGDVDDWCSRLPDNCPNDLRLVGSRILFNRAQEQIDAMLDDDIYTPAEARAVRLDALASTYIRASARFQRSGQEDYAVAFRTARAAKAELLLSDYPHGMFEVFRSRWLPDVGLLR